MLSATPSGRGSSVPTWNRTRTRTLGESRAFRYTIGTIHPRADDWIRTSMNPLTRRMPFLIEPRRH